jgi:hypothetical protein
VLRLQDVGGLDTLPGGGDLDKNTVLGDALLLVELDDVKGLVDGSLGVEGEPGINLSGDLAGDDLEDLLAELNEKVVEGSVDLLIKSLALSGGSVTDQDPAAFHSVQTSFLPFWTAASIRLAYSGFLEAARIKEGLVVASCGLYLPMVAKSPESQTTTVPVALSCSRAEDIVM